MRMSKKKVVLLAVMLLLLIDLVGNNLFLKVLQIIKQAVKETL